MPPFLNYFAKYECDCRCFDIFTPEEQKILKKYREENFAPKRLVYNERRAIGKCPLTPEEVKISFALIVFYLFPCLANGVAFTCMLVVIC